MESPWDSLRKALAAGDLVAARTAAEQLDRGAASTNQIAAEVLHELRQPLLGIKAYAQLLGEELGPKPGSPLNLLLAQVERMEQIISDFTRLATDKPAPRERMDLSLHVARAERLFRLNPESARISLEMELPPELFIRGNPRLIEQLTLNLLNNARDAMSGLGKIKVIVAREGDVPTLYVADWGPGIPDEVRQRIFEPYLTTKARGSGLGLAVCRRIAQEHGAEISLVSTRVLPDVPPPATLFKVAFKETEGQAPGRKRLLIVDDESIIRMVFRDLMGKECEVVDAETAEQAIEYLQRGPFDLIVTDKNLPGLSGLDLAQTARRLNPRSRVMLMTGYPSLVTAQQALDLGVMDYLLKPFDEIREVREKIRYALSAPLPGKFEARNNRIDVYEDNPATARQVIEALGMLGMQANVLTQPMPGGIDPPAGVVVSWDFTPAHGAKAVELGKTHARGSPFVVLAEHLTMDAALESLRGGAVACLPKLITDVKALSRELARALKIGPTPP